MKFRLLITLFLLSAQVAVAQLSEMGAMVGTTYYFGDLNNKHFKNNKFAFGLLYRYYLNDRIAFRLNYLYTTVEASDSESNDPNRVNRNLSFKSSINELGGAFEFHYYTYNPGDKINKFTTYILLGFNYFRMNPKASLNDVEYELNALSTEGQGLEGGPKRYKLDAFAIPIGLGAKFNLTKRMAIGIEYTMHFTFTDYLDDVSNVYFSTDVIQQEVGDVAAELSDRRIDKTAPVQDGNNNSLGLQRGNPSQKDWYGFTGIILSFRIGKEANTCAKWN